MQTCTICSQHDVLLVRLIFRYGYTRDCWRTMLYGQVQPLLVPAQNHLLRGSVATSAPLDFSHPRLDLQQQQPVFVGKNGICPPNNNVRSDGVVVANQWGQTSYGVVVVSKTRKNDIITVVHRARHAFIPFGVAVGSTPLATTPVFGGQARICIDSAGPGGVVVGFVRLTPDLTTNLAATVGAAWVLAEVVNPTATTTTTTTTTTTATTTTATITTAAAAASAAATAAAAATITAAAKTNPNSVATTTTAATTTAAAAAAATAAATTSTSPSNTATNNSNSITVAIAATTTASPSSSNGGASAGSSDGGGSNSSSSSSSASPPPLPPSSDAAQLAARQLRCVRLDPKRVQQFTCGVQKGSIVQITSLSPTQVRQEEQEEGGGGGGGGGGGSRGGGRMKRRRRRWWGRRREEKEGEDEEKEEGGRGGGVGGG